MWHGLRPQRTIFAAAPQNRSFESSSKAAKKPVSAKGVSAALRAVLKGGGTATLNTFAELADRYGVELQEGGHPG